MRWLRNMFVRVNARQQEHGTQFTINIGFTYEGLKALGLSQGSLDSFPEAFRVGMRGRAALVGDVGPHAPEHWEGGLGGPDIHAMGWIRTDSEQRSRRGHADHPGRNGRHRRNRDPLRAGHAWRWRTKTASDRRASISASPIRSRNRRSKAWTRRRYPGDGVLEADGTWRPMKPGEFLLGYEDEAGPDGTCAPEPFELRLNGTFMVFRKLYQDVAGFRRYLATAAKSLYGSDDDGPAAVGGRQDDGPLAERLPARSVPRQGRSRDRGGPASAQQLHLRRRRPGPALPARLAPASIQSAGDAVAGARRRFRRHRLLRRGVEYGPHLPEGVLEDDGVDRGLAALFIQADIERQFEFVQYEWMKGGEFIGLDPREQDPINAENGDGSQMSVPGAKRPFLFDLPTFVSVKGGEYLFVPGLQALQGLIEQRF